jgi:cystathionine gamma-synthase
VSPSPDSHGFATRAIHAGQAPDPTTGAIIPTLTLSATFQQSEPGNPGLGYEYGRVGNPNRDILETQLRALENASFASTFATGLAAEDALLRVLLTPGDTILVADDVYGGTYRLVTDVFGPWGVTAVFVDMTNPEELKQAIATHQPRVIWVETPSNPLMKITDIALVASLSRATLVVDSTFATPYLQHPLELGADVVVHSTTKYLGGHSDVMGGVVVTNNAEIAEKVAFQQTSAGAVLSPFESWLTTRGIKTLAVRMERHCQNAAALAERLSEDPRVSRVYYPGLPNHPGHAVAADQMRLFGGMVTIEVASPGVARKLVTSTELFRLAGSLGSVDSLVNHPATMTHAALQGTPQALPETLVRFSVGIESLEDLVADIDQALGKATS